MSRACWNLQGGVHESVTPASPVGELGQPRNVGVAVERVSTEGSPGMGTLPPR